MKRIDPFRALEPGDPRYVPRPRRGGKWLADRVRRGLAPLLLTAHPGLGKSTELRRAAQALGGDHCPVLVDLADLKHGADPDRMLYDLAVHTVHGWVESGPEAQPSPFLVQDLRSSDPHFPQGQGRNLKPAEMARAALDELIGAAGAERIPLLVDGLDRLEPEVGRAMIVSLLALEDLCELVLVATPALATGSDNIDVVDRFRVLTLDPLDPRAATDAGFLREVARSHLGDDAPVSEPVLESLLEASGGVLRDLLALCRDAWAYADEAVDENAVSEAIRDRTERFRRLLQAGDRKALQGADGGSGLEVAASRKTRLLQHGLLLERGSAEAAEVFVHPLVRRLLDRP